jgi:hypothetical protein
MDIEALTLAIEGDLKAIVSAYAVEPYWVTHYGANHIHPKHLVYWICVRSDAERDRLARDEGLMKRLRAALDARGYPIEGRADVHIGFESQETVDRVSGGNWWLHWK